MRRRGGRSRRLRDRQRRRAFKTDATPRDWDGVLRAVDKAYDQIMAGFKALKPAITLAGRYENMDEVTQYLRKAWNTKDLDALDEAQAILEESMDRGRG